MDAVGWVAALCPRSLRRRSLGSAAFRGRDDDADAEPLLVDDDAVATSRPECQRGVSGSARRVGRRPWLEVVPC